MHVKKSSNMKITEIGGNPETFSRSYDKSRSNKFQVAVLRMSYIIVHFLELHK